MELIEIPPIQWGDLFAQADTGDVIIFSGDSEISRYIEEGTGGDYSHSGMIVRPTPGGELLFWQTGPDPVVYDVKEKDFHGGAQIGNLNSVLSVLIGGGDVPFYRKLNFTRTPEYRAAIDNFITKMEGVPFGSIANLVFNWTAARMGVTYVPKDQVFCAELLAMTYHASGLLDLTQHPPTWYSPSSWSAKSTDVVLQAGATLDPEVMIDLTDMPIPMEPLQPPPKS